MILEFPDDMCLNHKHVRGAYPSYNPRKFTQTLRLFGSAIGRLGIIIDTIAGDGRRKLDTPNSYRAQFG